MPLPCRQASPASITRKSEESTITGTRAMSGSAASRFRNFRIACTESSRPSSMLTSRIWAPPGDLLARDLERLAVLAGLHQLREARRAGDVRPLADVDEVRVGPDHERVHAREAAERLDLRPHARRYAAHRPGDRADVRRRRAAAAADEVDEPRARPFAEVARHRLRRLVEAAEGVRQPGVRIGAHEARALLRQLLDMRAHLARPERAVDAHREERHVHDRDPERVDRLAREVAAGEVRDRDRGHHRKLCAALLERAHDAGERGFRVQRVERRLDEQQVHAAVDEAERLLVVGRLELGVAHGPGAGVVDVARERGRLVRRSERSGDPAAGVPAPRPSPRPRPCGRRARRRR